MKGRALRLIIWPQACTCALCVFVYVRARARVGVHACVCLCVCVRARMCVFDMGFLAEGSVRDQPA